MNEFERASEELEEALKQLDDAVDGIGKIIMKLADDNSEFVCTACIRTAKELFKIMKELAREEDCDRIREQFYRIAEVDLNG